MGESKDHGVDAWTDWLRTGRHGGDPTAAREVSERLVVIRDRVIDSARLERDATLLDLGSGDGLVAFGALGPARPSLRVIFADVSVPLLRHCRVEAHRRGVASRCEFVNVSADRLDCLRDSTVDAVTSRAVLAYVADKPRAFREIHRVLKFGGRLSAAEPIMRDQALEAFAMSQALAARDVVADGDILPLVHRWKAAQFPSTPEALTQHPLVNYTERNLLGWAQAAGFTDVRLELHIHTSPARDVTWAAFTAVAPHPWAPSLDEILSERFSTDERRRFEAVLRPMVEGGGWMSVDSVAYLVAVKQ